VMADKIRENVSKSRNNRLFPIVSPKAA